jgi:hypothetical protein
LPLLPLKLGYVADMLPFCGFSAGNQFLCGAIAASNGASRRKYCREGSASLGGGGGVGYGASGGRVLPLPPVVVVELVIFGGKKKRLGAQKFCLCCYRKLLRGPFAKLP